MVANDGRLDALMLEMGQEAHLASKLERLRLAKGWTQTQLVNAMDRAGTPIPQSAVSKLERAGKQERRTISMDEALGFSRVFGVSLAELLLPPGATDSMELLVNLASGPEHLEAMYRVSQSYDDHVAITADLTNASTDGPALFTEQARVAENKAARPAATGQDVLRLAFLRHVGVARDDIQRGAIRVDHDEDGSATVWRAGQAEPTPPSPPALTPEQEALLSQLLEENNALKDQS